MAADTSSQTTAITQPTDTTRELKPISILRRFFFCFGWSIFGLVFFYLVMVALSTISNDLTLERLYYIGWPRSASRHTGAVTAPVFALFLLVPPSSMWSLFMSVMVCCAHFAHFVIISSDVRVFVDQEINDVMFRDENTHPIWKLFPIGTAHVVGGIGMLAMLVVSSERCYGPALRYRRKQLPKVTLYSSAWIWMVFNIWFIDRLISAIINEKGQDEILYPIPFLICLLIGAVVCLRRHMREPVQSSSAPKQKTN